MKLLEVLRWSRSQVGSQVRILTGAASPVDGGDLAFSVYPSRAVVRTSLSDGYRVCLDSVCSVTCLS